MDIEPFLKKMYINEIKIKISHNILTGCDMDVKNAVLEVLKKEGTPLNAGRIAEISGLDRKEVDKAMKILKDEDLIVSPKRCYWEPKK